VGEKWASFILDIVFSWLLHRYPVDFVVL